jgi:RND superfamily putative drug exporter
MIAVFLSFVGSPIPSLKMLGLGLATAIAIDATLIRMVLVPATMSLLGDANWWLPRWLDKVLPVVDLEGGEDATTEQTDSATVPARAEELVTR